MLAHVMGIPAEASMLEVAPAGVAIASAVAIAGRTRLASPSTLGPMDEDEAARRAAEHKAARAWGTEATHDIPRVCAA
jgi:hypothetical protein